MMKFLEFGTFTRRVYELLDDEEYRAMQNVLLENPNAGVVVPGTGGVRKLRWAGSGRGKRGGLRVIYYVATSEQTFLMIHIYAKGEQEDLTPEQKRALKTSVARKG
jgi:mRNA-degrading endonuclease RelE of RelBE toxin-antitoxin system